MNKLLESLRRANPGMKLYSVLDGEFAPYGRVLDAGDTGELAAALCACPIPESGNAYVASVPELEALPLMTAIRRSAFGLEDIQAGYCNGHGYTLNAQEYHRCSEVNFTSTGLVLLLALPEALHDRRLASRDVVGFYLPPNIIVEIFPRVLHFAPCRVSEAGFNCLVVLTKGTNSAIDCVDTSLPGEDALLWMKNKWLLCHPGSPQAKAGAFVGIDGANTVLKL